MAGMGEYDRLLGHLAGCGDMFQGWWQGMGECGRGGVGVYGRGSGL